MPALVSLPELKTYLGLTTAADDTLLAACASNATVIAERDTGRTFSVASNVTRRYSTDGQAALVVHDMPYSDSSRTVSLDGTALTQDTHYWLLPDRRNQEVSTTIQLRHFEVGWNARHFNWFDGNLDSPRYQMGSPNDLSITGVVGHPTLPLDVKQAITELAAWLYWRAKSGASGFINTPTDEVIELADYPPTYVRFVNAWKIRTAASLV